MRGGQTDTQVVVSGMSGRLPDSDNLSEFWEHLINKDNLVTSDDRRWEPGTLILVHAVQNCRQTVAFEITLHGPFSVQFRFPLNAS